VSDGSRVGRAAAEASLPVIPGAAAELPLPLRPPYALCLLVGLGGLFHGVTGPLLSAFVPPLVGDALGTERTLIGAVMAIDNVLLLLLVPWAGAASDRGAAAGRGRMPMVLAGFGLASLGMAIFGPASKSGIAGLIAAMIVLYAGINLVRSPFQALLADLVPSRYRSLATGSVTFQMCTGAIVFLVLGRMLGMQAAFLVAASVVLLIALAFASRLREPAGPQAPAGDPTLRAIVQAAAAAVRGEVPGMRAVFVATFFLQLTFQTFTTWYALHATERFGVTPDEATIGFIAWAVGGVVGALPAGAIGVRLGRRPTMLLGFAVMAGCLFALDRVDGMTRAAALLGLAAAAWTLPTANAYPLFIEPVPRGRRGVLAALFLLCLALGGALGDPLNGRLFDVFGSYRALFLLMAAYTGLACVAVLAIPRGTGEANTGAGTQAAPR
jgi:MFS family permease